VRRREEHRLGLVGTLELRDVAEGVDDLGDSPARLWTLEARATLLLTAVARMRWNLDVLCGLPV